MYNKGRLALSKLIIPALASIPLGLTYTLSSRATTENKLTRDLDRALQEQLKANKYKRLIDSYNRAMQTINPMPYSGINPFLTAYMMSPYRQY